MDSARRAPTPAHRGRRAPRRRSSRRRGGFHPEPADPVVQIVGRHLVRQPDWPEVRVFRRQRDAREHPDFHRPPTNKKNTKTKKKKKKRPSPPALITAKNRQLGFGAARLDPAVRAALAAATNPASGKRNPGPPAGPWDQGKVETSPGPPGWRRGFVCGQSPRRTRPCDRRRHRWRPRFGLPAPGPRKASRTPDTALPVPSGC